MKWGEKHVCQCERVGERERERESRRAGVCERRRRIDGPSDCHLASDRRGERPSWGHGTICLLSFISVPAQMDRRRDGDVKRS